MAPSPNGLSPLRVKASTAPNENTSEAVPTAAPEACSGDMKPGDPTVIPVLVRALASVAREMPKSITRGPSGPSSTLEGFRSRCTSPAACTAESAAASPRARARAEASGKGPCSATASASDIPGTNTVLSHGVGSSTPAARTCAVNLPSTARAAATSRANRRLNSGSRASSGCTTFTATLRPPGVRAR